MVCRAKILLQNDIFRFVFGLLKSIKLELGKSITFYNLENDLFKNIFCRESSQITKNIQNSQY